MPKGKGDRSDRPNLPERPGAGWVKLDPPPCSLADLPAYARDAFDLRP
jgi:hypothetical protein